MRPSSDAAAMQEAKDWLARAAEDLQVAELALHATPRALGSSAYHSQQAAEKALKAFLAARQSPFRLTHDLVELETRCRAIDGTFAMVAGAAEVLTPYAIQFRYPGGPLAPPVADAVRALELAEEVVRYVRTRLGL